MLGTQHAFLPDKTHLFIVLNYTQRFFLPGCFRPIILDTAEPFEGATTGSKLHGNVTGCQTTFIGVGGKGITPLGPTRWPKAPRTMALMLDSNASMNIPETSIALHSVPQTTRDDQMHTTSWHPAPEQPPRWKILTQWTIAKFIQLLRQCLQHTPLHPSTRVSRPGTTDASASAHGGW